MNTKLRIKGGSVAFNWHVWRINDDGSEVEITDISSMTISPISAGEKVTVSIVRFTYSNADPFSKETLQLENADLTLDIEAYSDSKLAE